MGVPVGVLQSYPSKLRQEIYDLRDKNTGWGAISILVELEASFGYSKTDLPSPDAIHRYLQQCGFIKPKVPKGNLPNGRLPLVDDFHDLWEMDAQGAVAVKGIGYISMINIKDTKSKAYIYSFPVQVKGKKSQPKTQHYLWALRLAFEEFGLPKAIQVDKDSVFIDNTSKSPFPSVLRLFLLGLGIELCFIELPPPLKQAMVERSHQTMYKQVLEGKTYQSWHQLFMNTNYRRKVLNEKYPCRTLNKKAPLQAFPKAKDSGRHYSIEQEQELLKTTRIEQYLAKCTWFRKVSSVKTISLGEIYYLKNAQPSTYVQIKFCAQSKKLVFRDVNEQIVKELFVKDFAKKLVKQQTLNQLVAMRKKLLDNKNFPLK